MIFLRQSISCFLICLAFVGITNNSFSFAEESFLEVGIANDLDKKIYKILKQEYGTKVKILSIAPNDHLIRLDFSYDKPLVDNVVLVNTIDWTLDKDADESIANVVQIRFFPKLSSLEKFQEISFFSAVMDWQYNKVVPQLVYLTAEKEIAYGWDIPVYKDDPVLGKTVISIVNDLSNSWNELFLFLSSRVDFTTKSSIAKTIDGQTDGQTDEQINVAVHLLPRNEGVTSKGGLAFKGFLQKAKKSDGIIIVKGYVSSDNDTKENIEISKNRANQIKRMMVKEGIDISRIKVFGRGAKDPIATNKTREGRNMNRRVELILINQ